MRAVAELLGGHMPECPPGLHQQTVLRLQGHWQSSATDLPACPQAGLTLVRANCNRNLHAQGMSGSPFFCDVIERTWNLVAQTQ